MPLLKGGRVVEDPFVALDDDAPLPQGQPVIVGLARWRRERETLIGLGVPLGLRLDSHERPAEAAEDLGRFAVIALAFPKFTDGRAYSAARLLRERYGYKGEIRAVGNVLRDQLRFMHRVGFDAFALDCDRPEEAFAAALGEIAVNYQPAADGAPVAATLRQRRGMGSWSY